MNVEITKEFLKDANACSDGIAFWESLGSPSSPVAVFRGALASREFSYCEWLISKCLPDRRSAVELAVFAAELALPIFERSYPNDGRPREAIESARAWLVDPSEANVERCRVAYSVATAAAASSAAYSASSSSFAASSAAFASSAAYSAAFASSAAYSAAFASSAADASAAWSAFAEGGAAARLATWEKIGQKFEEILERDSPATVCHQCGEASPAPDHFTRHVED